MLPRRHRLSRSTWFRKTLNTQPLFHSKGCVVYGLPRRQYQPEANKITATPTNSQSQRCFVGVIASKKVDKRAVYRNRYRRRVYEAVRLDWLDCEELHRRYAAIVVIVRNTMSTVDFQTFRASFHHSMTKALASPTNNAKAVTSP